MAEPKTELKPAAELAASASKPYPNDSAEYRRARTALLQAPHVGGCARR